MGNSVTECRADVFLSRECNPADKIAFAGVKTPDSFIAQKMKRISVANAQGVFEAVKRDWTPEELAEATGYVKGEVDSEGNEIPAPEGLRYQLIPCWLRVAEVVGEQGRAGQTDSLSSILGESGKANPFG